MTLHIHGTHQSARERARPFQPQIFQAVKTSMQSHLSQRRPEVSMRARLGCMQRHIRVFASARILIR